jgi:hypothetical protein
MPPGGRRKRAAAAGPRFLRRAELWFNHALYSDKE